MSLSLWIKTTGCVSALTGFVPIQVRATAPQWGEKDGGRRESREGDKGERDRERMVGRRGIEDGGLVGEG